MLNRQNMSTISQIKMMVASRVGQPFISGLWKRLMFITQRRVRNTTQLITTKNAMISKVLIRKGYTLPRLPANKRWCPVSPSNTISRSSTLTIKKPT